jgi:hypothetical protein
MNANAKKALIAGAVVLTLVVMVVGYIAYRNHYTDGFNRGMTRGYNQGTCDQKREGIKDGYEAYLTSHQLGYTATFTESGDSCTSVKVDLTKTRTFTDEKGNKHVVTTTCKTAQIKLPDQDHPLPYTEDVDCQVKDESTAKVDIGQAVTPGG